MAAAGAALFRIKTVPAFAINQRALLLRTPHGNILWDCIANLDPATKALITALGGISAIAISHPHYYTTMQEWAAAFDAPVYLHASDREWVMRDSPAIHFWEAMRWRFSRRLRLLRLGGHFAGGTVLHWQEGEGYCWWAIFCRSRRERRRLVYVELPEYLPLPARTVASVVSHLKAKRSNVFTARSKGRTFRPSRTRSCSGRARNILLV
jgi:hypothetical protein